MNEMRKLMESVDKILNENIAAAIAARVAQGDRGAKILKSAIGDLQRFGDDDKVVDAVFFAVEKVMPELDTDSDEFWDALYTVSLEEGIFGKKDRSIEEIGAELADRSTVRSAASYAVEFAGNPDRFLELGPEEQKSVWDTMKTVVLPVWEDQQRG